MNPKNHNCSLLTIKNVSKKLILTLFFSTFLSISTKAQITNENINACGHAVSSMLLEYNNMGATAFHDLQVILHMNISNEEKSTLVSNNPVLLAFANKLSNSFGILNNNNYAAIMNDTSNHNNIINVTSNDLGYGDVAGAPNYDPCKGYKQGQADCILVLQLCILAAAAVCTGTTFGFFGCFLAGSSLCANVAGACADSNDKAHPNCVPASATGWQEYLVNYSQGNY